MIAGRTADPQRVFAEQWPVESPRAGPRVVRRLKAALALFRRRRDRGIASHRGRPGPLEPRKDRLSALAEDVIPEDGNSEQAFVGLNVDGEAPALVFGLALLSFNRSAQRAARELTLRLSGARQTIAV